VNPDKSATISLDLSVPFECITMAVYNYLSHSILCASLAPTGTTLGRSTENPTAPSDTFPVPPLSSNVLNEERENGHGHNITARFVQRNNIYCFNFWGKGEVRKFFAYLLS
jgi:hypothetical protein